LSREIEYLFKRKTARYLEKFGIRVKWQNGDDERTRIPGRSGDLPRRTLRWLRAVAGVSPARRKE